MTSSASTVFTSQQFAHPYPDGIQHHYWTAARQRIILRYLRRILKHNEGATVLDIGCGRGLTVDYCRVHGIHAIGCELGNPEPICAAVKPHLYLGTDAFSLDERLRASVGIILLLDVLEHLEEPAVFLDLCHKAFSNCTDVFITLPARTETWSNYDDYYGHRLRYHGKSLAALCGANSFELVRKGYFFHLLYPPARLMAALHIDRRVVMSSPKGSQHWAHHLLSAYFDWEERLVPAFVPGTSIYGHLRRGEQTPH